MDTFIDQFGVRVSPKIINFLNCEVDENYVRLVQVQNINSKSVTVRFYPPQSKDLSMMCKNHEKIISPGLNHVCSLKYKMSLEEKATDRLIVTVDGQVIEIPINMYPSAPKLVIAEEIDFGTVVMANKVITAKTTLYNEGSKTGSFKFVYNGKKPLNINPNEGAVYPRSTLPIQLEFVTIEAQVLDETCQCLFEGDEPFEIRVKGRVVQRSLELLELKTPRNLECIQFSHTYYGSDRSEAALLFNNSPEIINFVAILEEDTVGQESGAHVAMTSSGVNPRECTNPLTSLITMFPNQGRLQPYEKVPVLFRFSPRWQLPRQAFKKTLEPPIEQTFAVFIKIQIVGANFSTSEENAEEQEEDKLLKCQSLELGITGTAVPVLVDIQPSTLQFQSRSLVISDYSESSLDEFETLYGKLRNRSGKLSARIEFSKEAHFLIEPRILTVPPDETVQIQVKFIPRQYGNFETKQHYRVYSFVKDTNNEFTETEQVIFEHFFFLSGNCYSKSTPNEPIFNKGMNPKITNKVGINTADFRFMDLGVQPAPGTRAALITTAAHASGGVNGTKLFRSNESYKHPYNSRTAIVAFPNDRAESIRPSEYNKEYRSIFKRTKRYNFIDPDYSYKDNEAAEILHHKDRYRTMIRKRHMLRRIAKLNAKFASYENELDLGIIPGNYLISPRLNQEEIDLFIKNATTSKDKFQLLSSKDLKLSENVIDINKLDTFHAIPTTDEEKTDCTTILSPQQLHQVVIGPSTVNFGDVAIRSSSTQNLTVVNNLDKFIHVTVTIDCKELRQSGPLSQVIPAKTKTVFPLVFDSNKKGKFQRNLNYTINGYYHSHVIVLATAVLNQLKLSTDCLLLRSQSILPPDTGIRACITLTNPLNSPTEFLWEPIFHNTGGISFSIRPKEGIVESNSQLDCEVMFHPGFTAPSEGDFVLRLPGNSTDDENSSSTMGGGTTDEISGSSNQASGGAINGQNSQTDMLHCIAVLGNPNVIFQSRRVMFGNIPINLSSQRTAILVNTGSSHAFYRVVPDNMYEEFPGMSISPLKGSIPIGGQVELQIKYLPESTNKFDFSVPIVIRGWKEIELKISGTVIIPDLDVNVKEFNFAGVAVGSEKKIPFDLINKSNCRAEVEFEFTKQRDFQVETVFADDQRNNSELNKTTSSKVSASKNHKYSIQLKALEVVKCFLKFTPTEVASYEFPWRVQVNRIPLPTVPISRGETMVQNGSPSRSLTQVSSTTYEISDTIPNKQTRKTQGMSKIITGTATRRPIDFSSKLIEFDGTMANSSKKLAIFNTLEHGVDVSLKVSKATWKYGTEKCNMKSMKRSLVPFIVQVNDEINDLHDDINFNLVQLGETMTIQFTFEPEKSGHYHGRIPIYINNSEDYIFTYITLTGYLPEPKMICHPTYLYFTPVPLATEIHVNFLVTTMDFREDTELEVRLPLVTRPKCFLHDNTNSTNDDESSSKILPFKLSFGSSREIYHNKPSEIWVRVSFYSEQVLSVRSYIQLSTKSGSYTRQLGISALADNCLLSWLTFFNKHSLNYHIVCDEGKPLEGTEVAVTSGYMDFGEAQLRNIGSKDGHGLIDRVTSSSRNSTTVTSSNFEDSSGTSFEDTITESESIYFGTPIAPREGALNKIVEQSLKQQQNRLRSSFGSGEQNNQIITKETGGSGDINDDPTNASVTLEDIRSALAGNRDSTTLSNNGARDYRFDYANSQGDGDDDEDDEEILEIARIKYLGQQKNMPTGSELELLLSEAVQDNHGGHESTDMSDYDSPCLYESDVLQIVQRWFALHGWPGNINPINVPNSLRSSLLRRFGSQTSTSSNQSNQAEGKKMNKKMKSSNDNNMENTSGLKQDTRDVYDMVLHLTGKQVVGINTTVALPANPIERACHIYVQNATLIAFVENQAGLLPQVMPEFLMDPSEYELWHQQGCPGIPKDQIKPTKFSALLFEKVSKKAWTTLLLQIIKAFILSKVTIKNYRQALQIVHSNNKHMTKNQKSIPEIQIKSTASNCYSIHERILLAWLNHLYDTQRNIVWSNCTDNNKPPARWIINFDNDFMDSLILATAIAAYVPYMIESHFKYMFSNPQNPEQFLHNSLKVVSALKELGFEFDIQAIDIVDPNPVMMLLLTTHLFHNLPLYIPKSDVIFVGPLHEPITKHVQVSNPTSKPLNYDCIILGPDASDFSCPRGSTLSLPGKGSIKWPIIFVPRFLRPAEALIMMVGRKSGANIPANMVFRVKSKPASINTIVTTTTHGSIRTEKVTGKCYEMKKIEIKVLSPYKESGEFCVKLIENLEHKPSLAIKDQDSSKSKPPGKRVPVVLESIKPENKLRAFFCHQLTIYLDPSTVTPHKTLPVFYLPFHMGLKSCSIVFSNPEIGEFVQAIEATAQLPDPIPLQNLPSLDNPEQPTVRVSTSEAASRGLDGNPQTTFWKCEVGRFVKETVRIPVRNVQKEAALLEAAQHHLSAQEVSRRQITGTLASSSLLISAVQMLALDDKDNKDIQAKNNKKNMDTKYSNKGNLIDFEIECESNYFKCPARIQVPDPLISLTKQKKSPNSPGECVEIPIEFHASSAGTYPCTLILTGPDDVRVHRIECCVTPEGLNARLQFTAPVNDIIVQKLPIVNKTRQDWPLRASFISAGVVNPLVCAFTGPDFVVAKALTVSQYPLQFKPMKEGKLNVQLCLINEADGTQHTYELFGEGESPLAMETIQFECSVGERITRTLQIPNNTRRKQLFCVESDLDWMINGESELTVLPSRTTNYQLNIESGQHGFYKGVLAFVAGKKEIKELDSDGEEIPDIFADSAYQESSGDGLYRIWYALEVDVKPGDPKDEFIIECACLESKVLEIPLHNPISDKQLTIEVHIEGKNLKGVKKIELEAQSTVTYELIYTPSMKGEFEGKIVFYEKNMGEFWYKIHLKATEALVKEIEAVSCELGKWTTIDITIDNLDESSDLIIQTNIDNNDCYAINLAEIDWLDSTNKNCLKIKPLSNEILSIRFTPCAIGSREHHCQLTLKTKLLGDLKYQLNGIGLPPSPADSVGINAEAGSNRTVLIPFQNPCLETILIDIKISEEHDGLLNKYKAAEGLMNEDNESDTGIFKLLLKNNKKLKLKPKQSLEIPVSFAPQEMRKYNAICSIVLRRKDGEPVISEDDFENLIVKQREVPSAYDRYSLRWLYPIQGIPEASITNELATNIPVVHGPIRATSKHVLQFNLWGLPPPACPADFGAILVTSAPSQLETTPVNQSKTPLIAEEVQEFSLALGIPRNLANNTTMSSLIKGKDDADNDTQLMKTINISKSVLEESLEIKLEKIEKRVEQGLSIVHCAMIFKPMKKFRTITDVIITSASGGVWKFPVKFIGTECEPDDEIELEAIGLNKPVSVRFYLTSQSFDPIPFNAYFLKGADPDFTFSPASGILPAISTQLDTNDEARKGLPFTITWNPKSYSRCKGAVLIIETDSMEWIYKFSGVPPRYLAPQSGPLIQTNWDSKQLETLNSTLQKKSKNFLQNNIELISTAVSSPIKGAPLFTKIV